MRRPLFAALALLAVVTGKLTGKDASAILSNLLSTAQVLAHIRGLAVREDRVLLRFGAPGDGTFRLRAVRGGAGAAYDTRLLDALREEGISPDPSLKLDAVLEKLSPSEGGGNEGVRAAPPS